MGVRVLSGGVEAALEIDHLERPPKRLWNRMLAEPDRAPEYIALAAAERFGPQAEEWVRIAGPGHTPEQLARVAFKKHVRLARLEGGALGVGGVVTLAPDMVALLWIQSRMVFYIAAAYGYDPRHPMRPAEYLALQGLYDTPAEAREALDGIGQADGPGDGRARAQLPQDRRAPPQAGEVPARRLFRRYADKLIPLIGAPIGAVQNGSVTKQLGQRALQYYAP